MKKRIAYLHIGTTKTGSTTIQASLDINRPLLRKKNIVMAPNSLRRGNSDYLLALLHRDLSRNFENLKHLRLLNIKNKKEKNMLDNDTKAKYTNFINSRPKKDMIFTDEYFFTSNFKEKNCINKVIKFLNSFNFDCNIIIYLRNQTEWILCDYIQNIKGGGIMSLNQYISKVTRLNSSYDLFAFIKNLESAKAELSIRPYKRDLIKDWDVLEDFYSLLKSFDYSSISNLKIINDRNSIRLSKMGIKEIIFFNKEFRNKIQSFRDDEEIRDVFKKLVDRIACIHLNDIPLEIETKYLDIIKSRFSQGNKKLVEKYPILDGYLNF